MKKVLITGANSYIGVSFENYVKEHYASELNIETVDMIDGSWRHKDFSPYDIVYHVAGLAQAPCYNFGQRAKEKRHRKLPAFRIDREPLPPCGVSVRVSPCGGRLTRRTAWHGGHSLSIPAAISCKRQHTTGGSPCPIFVGSMMRSSRKTLSN